MWSLFDLSKKQRERNKKLHQGEVEIQKAFEELDKLTQEHREAADSCRKPPVKAKSDDEQHEERRDAAYGQ